MAKKNEVQFAIQAFEIRSFSFTAPSAEVRKDRLDYKIQHLFIADPEKPEFGVGFRIKVTAGKKSAEELASIETFTNFSLKGVSKEQMSALPEHLVITFLSISYSNTRGALSAKAQGTIVGDVPLPLINPTEIVKSFVGQSIRNDNSSV